MKILDDENMKELELWRQELQNLVSVQHLNVVKLHGYMYSKINRSNWNSRGYDEFKNAQGRWVGKPGGHKFSNKRKRLCLLLEICETSLQAHIENLRNVRVSFARPLAMELFGQLCKAVEYCHSKNLFHGDIKPANILLNKLDTPAPILKLSDVGVAVLIRNGMQSVRGASHHLPPWFDGDKPDYPKKTDSWAAARVLLDMLTTHSTVAVALRDTLTLLNELPTLYPVPIGGLLKALVSSLLASQPSEQLILSEFLFAAKFDEIKRLLVGGGPPAAAAAPPPLASSSSSTNTTASSSSTITTNTSNSGRGSSSSK